MLLTSIGLSSEPAFNRVRELCENKKQKVALVVTASEGKEENKYVKLAKQQFESLGAEVDLIDLEEGQMPSEDTTLIYVAGGNTFRLMKSINETNFKDEVMRVISKNKGTYIGVSAGSIVAGTNIKGAEILGDENKVELEDFEGMNLVDYTVFPHADEAIRNMVLEEGENYRKPVFIDNPEMITPILCKNGEILEFPKISLN